jgi:hypothetical protein
MARNAWPVSEDGSRAIDCARDDGRRISVQLSSRLWDDLGDSWLDGPRRPDPEIQIERLGNFTPEERPDRLAGDPSDDFATTHPKVKACRRKSRRP